MIKVAVVDDDLVWIKQVYQYINFQDDMFVVWNASNNDNAIALDKTGVADVIIITVNDIDSDFGTPNYNGIFIANEILKSRAVKIIVMTNLTNFESIKKSIMAGAVNYLFKKDFAKLPEIIRDICSTHIYN